MPELKRLHAGHAPAVLAFELANRAYFAASVSDRGDEFFDQFTDRHSALLAEQEAGICAFYVLVAEVDLLKHLVQRQTFLHPDDAAGAHHEVAGVLEVVHDHCEHLVQGDLHVVQARVPQLVQRVLDALDGLDLADAPELVGNDVVDDPDERQHAVHERGADRTEQQAVAALARDRHELHAGGRLPPHLEDGEEVLRRLVVGAGSAGTALDLRQPRMLQETPAQLVAHLSDANGWWRDTAQQLLVLKQDKSVVPVLKQLARSANQLARIHAIWTLEGLGSADAVFLRELMKDADPQVRIQALRASESLYKAGDKSFAADYKSLSRDTDTDVVRKELDALPLKPALLPLLYKATKTQSSQASATYGHLLRPEKMTPFQALEEIDKLLDVRLKQVANIAADR